MIDDFPELGTPTTITRDMPLRLFGPRGDRGEDARDTLLRASLDRDRLAIRARQNAAIHALVIAGPPDRRG